MPRPRWSAGGAKSIVAEQCRPHRILEQFAPRTARLLPQSGQFMVRPSCRANTLRSRKQVCNSPFSIRQGRIVTTASQQLPDRHQCNRGSEPRLSLGEISSCANQRRGVRSVGSGALEGDIEKPLILRGCEPFALVTTALNQIEKYLTAVEIGILPCQCAVDGEIGRPARSPQSILSIGLIGAAVQDQKTLTKTVDGIILLTGIRGVAHAFSKCNGGFPQPLADQRLCSEPMPRPEFCPSSREQLLKLIVAARFKQA